MNTFLTTGPVLEHAISVHARATPRDPTKIVPSRLPTGSFWVYLAINQSVTYFPDLVTTSGEGIFNACWPLKESRVVMRVFSLLAASLALGLFGCSKEPHTSQAKSPP